MNPIELITGLPDWKFTRHCQSEIDLTGKDLVDESDFVWQVGNVAVAGFIYYSLIAPPWMWFVLAENVGIKDLVDFRRVARFIPKGTITPVQSENKLAMRFAKLFEFEETGEVQHYFDNEYKLMRKK